MDFSSFFTDENFIFTNYSLSENQIWKNFDQNNTMFNLQTLYQAYE